MSVTSLEIVDRDLLWDGKPFGPAGAYERLTGIVKLAVDPKHPANAGIVDLGLVPRGEDGRVHFDGDFALVRPVEPGRGSERLLFDVLNRGLAAAMYTFNDARGDLDRGNGFLMRQGYTIASCGWQYDVLSSQLGLMSLRAPETFEDGEPLSGPIMCEFQPARPTEVLPLDEGGLRPYPTRDLADPTAVLTVRDHSEAPARVIPREEWQLARLEDGHPVPDPTSLYLAAGFEAGKLYTFVYKAYGAPVVGAGLLAVRDVAGWLKPGEAAAGNPCAGAIRNSYAFGESQSAFGGC